MQQKVTTTQEKDHLYKGHLSFALKAVACKETISSLTFLIIIIYFPNKGIPLVLAPWN